MKLETIGPTNTEFLAIAVRNPEMQEFAICSICALACGAVEWRAAWDRNEFTLADCPGCGRKTYLSAVGNWKWE